MSQSIDLQVLKDKQRELLLAEVAALLHDWQKCIDMKVASDWSKNPNLRGTNKVREWQQRGNVLKPGDFAQVLSQISVSLIFSSIDLKTLCQEGQDPSSAKNHPHFLVRQLGECHGLAHVDKELGIDEQTDQACDRIGTAFGYEPVEPRKLFEPLLATVKPLLASLAIPEGRANVLAEIHKVFSNAWGDTRRPINEVTLWDWGYAVANLYKPALAGHLLGVTTSSWRLLRVNFDVLGLYAKAIKIADLLSYQHIIDKACERVKQLVEEEYPLGNEVYRDTTGIYFTFPDLPLPAELLQEIRRRVEEADLELAPRIAVTKGDGSTAIEQLKGILAKAHGEARNVLAQPFDCQNLNLEHWQKEWRQAVDSKSELCPVCRLRPKKERAEACDTCLGRRGSRIEAWRKDPQRTIWMDELADLNGRVALIVGKFGLDDWLSGDLVQTMLVKAEPNNPAGCTPKNPSPARLRRVWETCRRFWRKTAQDILDSLPDRQRWLLEVRDTNVLPPAGVVCDGTLDGKTISVWRMGDALLTVSFVAEKPGKGRLSLSWEFNGRKGSGTYQVRDVKSPSAEYLYYHPTLTLLASPDQFLALVPAADALEIAKQIRCEYTKQFGKVHNRLPLFLGIVFFPRKMPLMAVMDAARRMMGVPLKEEQWTVECCRRDEKEPNQYVRLSQGGQRVALRVPIKMGDNNTDDIWYPYFFVDRFADGTPDNREYRFQHNGRWLVRVNDLKEDDVVAVTPSRFAYLWLEHTAKRFEFDPAKHILHLDELTCLKQMWDALKGSGITDTGLRNVQALLEVKGAAWGSDSNEFEHLTHTALKDAGLFQHKDSDGNPLPDAVTPQDVTSGRFARCLELYLHILKRRIKED